MLLDTDPIFSVVSHSNRYCLLLILPCDNIVYCPILSHSATKLIFIIFHIGITLTFHTGFLDCSIVDLMIEEAINIDHKLSKPSDHMITQDEFENFDQLEERIEQVGDAKTTG